MPAIAEKDSLEHPLAQYIAAVPDFPKPGILFRDISPLLREHFSEAIQALANLFTDAEWEEIDVLGGVESRGFILAAGLAMLKNKGFVKIRKPGKLPGNIAKLTYELEYGSDALEMQHGSGRMLLVDDVLATGGTLGAAAKLAETCGYTLTGITCLINLTFLNNFTYGKAPVRTLIQY